MDQLDNELRSAVIDVCRLSAEVICLKHFVSSANSNNWDVMTVGKSFINTKNSGGPVCFPGVLQREQVESSIDGFVR